MSETGKTPKTYTIAITRTPATPTATFSFDGANAGKLVGTTLGMEYSLDGTSYSAVTAADQQLTATQLAGITATNGIKIRVAAIGSIPVSSVQSITITTGTTPSALTLSTGTATGKVGVNAATTQEYRVTDTTGATVKQDWTTGTGAAVDTTATCIAGDKVEVRVKATGTVQSSAAASTTVIGGNIGV
ncbi:Uncharacterised protein [Acetobacterium wieringae]|nr:Uncharacterised protein [Acetobacterium wieringae]